MDKTTTTGSLPQTQRESITTYHQTSNDDDVKSQEGRASHHSHTTLSTIDMDHTLILLDWDDTLFPTSTICDIISQTDGNGMALIRDSQITLLRSLGTQTFSLLTHLIGTYGAQNIHIVTNSLSGWIQDSLLYAMCIADVYKQIERLLSHHNVNTESAQTLYGEKSEGSSPMVWKRLCFDSILNESKKAAYSHIISIGDQWTDHYSVKQSIAHHSELRKCAMHHVIKLKTEPNLNDLINEMLYVQTCFDQFFTGEKILKPVIVDYHREEINYCLKAMMKSTV